MRGRVWAASAGLVLAAAPALPANAAAAPVALVAGVRAGADVAATLRSHHLGVLHSAALTGAVSVEVPAGQAAAATSVLRADPAVTYVEPDHLAYAAFTPDDPDYGDQWGIRQTGVDTVWDDLRGSDAVTVAVVDTGVSPIADLAGRLLPGKDFVNHDDDAADDFGHGTQAADVIAGAGDNGRGIAGICWSCRILPVKVLGDDGSGTYSNIAEGIRWAADQGADIINLSLGGSSDSRILRDAVAYAVAKGALVIAAAGNNASAAPHYPAAIPSVLAIGASTAGDARYPFSNYGADWVDLAAPGCNPSSQPSGIVTRFCGTSSSAPFVAGVAALLASTAPRPSAAAIRTLLTSTAHPLAGNWVAAGRVDAAAALAALPFWVTGITSGQVVGDSVTITPHATSAVTASIGGVLMATATSAPWTLTVDTRAVVGPATITVAEVGGSSVDVAVHGDHAAPATSFRIRPPALGHGVLTIGARASDDAGVARVSLYAGGTLVGTDTTSPYAFRWNSAPHTGSVTLTLRAYDRAGRVATASTAVRVDNTLPAVRIHVLRRQEYVDATATDSSGIARMELLVNGQVVQRFTGSRHRFTLPTGSSGVIRVRAYDRAGNQAVSSARTWYR